MRRAPQPSTLVKGMSFTPELRCIVCRERFDFSRGETAIVLRQIAYGYDFVHARHENTALGWIFVDPEYDRPEFSRDARRAKVPNVVRQAWPELAPL